MRNDETTDARARRRIALLDRVARLGAMTAEALAEREGVSIAVARGRLLAATRRGLLACTRPLHGEPAIFTATRAGVRACGRREYPPARVSAANAAHTIACVRVAVRLERAHPQHVLLGEPDLRVLEAAAPAGARDGVTVGEAGELRCRLSLPRRPDMLLIASATGAPAIAIEVELSVKSPRRLLASCLAWARCNSVAGVVYLAPPHVERPLLRAIDGADAHARVLVLPLGSLAAQPFGDPVTSAA